MSDNEDDQKIEETKVNKKWREPNIPAYLYPIAMGLFVLLILLRVLREAGLL